MMPRSRLLLMTATIALAASFAHAGYALLGFKNANQVASGSWFRWFDPRLQHLSRLQVLDSGEPLIITYQIADDFMATQSAETRANAVAAVESAFESWSESTNGFVQFVRAPWGAVENRDSIFHDFYTGPSVDEFCAVYCPECSIWCGGVQPPDPNGVLPGWGADIDIFSRPSSFTLVSNGILYQLNNVLGFAAVHRPGGNPIYSADIYLNETQAEWTTDGAQASQSFEDAAAGRSVSLNHMTYCGADKHAAGECADPLHAHGGAGGGGAGSAMPPIYDLETVVLHEIGHALGLDHPNQAQAFGGKTFDPFLFTPQTPNVWTAQAVMHSAYNGLKRSLHVDDLGGMAFLYPIETLGDLDADGAISMVDVLHAIELIDEGATPTPWEVNRLDFLVRNGVIDIDELSQLLLWAFHPDQFPPGKLREMPTLCTGDPTTVTLDANVEPYDIGLGGPILLHVDIDNPDSMPVSGWDINIAYDPAVFSNPVLVSGDFLPQGIWLNLGPDDGEIRFGKLAVGLEDMSTSGRLGTIRFDVNIQQAVAQENLTISLNDVVVPVTCPSLHHYGDFFGETLIVDDGQAVAWNYDANGDNQVDLEDWYAFIESPIDVNLDDVIDDTDRMLFRCGLRGGELEDMGALD